MANLDQISFIFTTFLWIFFITDQKHNKIHSYNIIKLHIKVPLTRLRLEAVKLSYCLNTCSYDLHNLMTNSGIS